MLDAPLTWSVYATTTSPVCWSTAEVTSVNTRYGEFGNEPEIGLWIGATTELPLQVAPPSIDFAITATFFLTLTSFGPATQVM
jgi:hypothetical protein